MRALVLAAALSLAACAGVQGAGDRGVPFSGVAPAAAAAPTAAPAGSYPIAVDLPAGAYRSDPNHTSRIRVNAATAAKAMATWKIATLWAKP